MVMLCQFTKEEELKNMAKSNKYLISEKINGTRVLYMNGSLFNREGLNVSKKYPHILKELFEQGFDRAILDGEVAFEKDGKTDLYNIQLKENWNKAKYFIFDMVIDSTKRDIHNLSLNARLLLLEEQLMETENLKILKHSLFNEKSFEMIKQLQNEKREGFVLKLINSPYVIDFNSPFKEDRTIYWKKFKFLVNYEVNIVGYNDDRKHHSYGSIKTSLGDVGLLNMKNYEIFLSQKPTKAIVRGEAELSVNKKILKPVLCYFILNGMRIPVLDELKTQHNFKVGDRL